MHITHNGDMLTIRCPILNYATHLGPHTIQHYLSPYYWRSINLMAKIADDHLLLPTTPI